MHRESQRVLFTALKSINGKKTCQKYVQANQTDFGGMTVSCHLHEICTHCTE